MKKGSGIFFYVLYVGLLSGLLMLQIQKIAGDAERFAAMTELILLLLSVFGIIILYIKGQSGEKKENDIQTGKQEGYEKNYEQFLKWVAEYGLSEREKEVAWLICRGFTNRQIAEELFVAETTVKKHVTHIYEKCRVSGRKELKELWRNVPTSI